MRKATGWVALHRKIWLSDIWNSNKPFDDRSAWVDLMLLADFEDTEKISRGQILTSYGELATRWNWSKSRAWRFLHILEDMGMVKIRRTQNGTKNGTEDGTEDGTVVTIVKYAFYQDVWNGKWNGSENGKQNEKRKHYNNNNNNTPSGSRLGAPGPGSKNRSAPIGPPRPLPGRGDSG